MLKIKAPDYQFCPFCGKSLDVVTQEGSEYKHCKPDKWTYYPSVDQSSNAIIIRNGKILLSQRGREPHRGKWMFPAGFVDFGEHPEDTVIREVEEETGLIAKNPVFFDILQTTDDPRSMGNFAFYYKVEVKGKPENKDRKENLAVGWFDIDKVPEIAWKAHRDIIQKLQRQHGF